MKLSELEKFTLAATCLCLAVMLGYFLAGRQSAALVEIPSAPAVEESEAPAGPPAALRVNINTARKSELMSLPGIGEKLALDIIDYRMLNGPFRYVEELIQVPGIDTGILDGLMDYITVGG